MNVLPVPEAPPSGFFVLVRHIAIAGLAGLLAGVLVAGIGGRIFMRIAGALGPELAQGVRTEAGFTVGEVTLSGTMELVIFVGIFGGLVGAVHYVLFRPWLAWAGRGRGLVFGVVLFSIGSATSDVLNPDNFDFAILGNSVLLVGLIVLLFVLFGVAIEGVYLALDRRLPSASESGVASRIVYSLIAVQGLPIALFLVPFTLFSTESCSCNPPLIASAFVVIAAVGTLLWFLSTAYQRAARASLVLGYLGLTGAALFGLIRAVSDSVEIIG